MPTKNEDSKLEIMNWIEARAQNRERAWKCRSHALYLKAPFRLYKIGSNGVCCWYFMWIHWHPLVQILFNKGFWLGLKLWTRACQLGRFLDLIEKELIWWQVQNWISWSWPKLVPSDIGWSVTGWEESQVDKIKEGITPANTDHLRKLDQSSIENYSI